MLNNKVAIVTGGTRGIGYAVVKKYLENRASVVLCGSRQETADRAVAQLKAEHPDWPVEGIAPDLGRYIVEFAFGDIYSRGELTLQERELVTVASLLAAGGCEPQLAVHLHGALNAGVPPEKLVEALIQCVPYTGFPRVLNAVFTAKRVFEERGSA